VLIVDEAGCLKERYQLGVFREPHDETRAITAGLVADQGRSRA
jgi:hypothetical protein